MATARWKHLFELFLGSLLNLVPVLARGFRKLPTSWEFPSPCERLKYERLAAQSATKLVGGNFYTTLSERSKEEGGIVDQDFNFIFFNIPPKGPKMVDYQGWKFHYQPPPSNLATYVPALTKLFEELGLYFKLVKAHLVLDTFKSPPLPHTESANNMYGKFFTFYNSYDAPQMKAAIEGAISILGPCLSAPRGIPAPYDCTIGGMADAAAGWSLRYGAKRSGSYYVEHNMLMVSNENNQVQVLSSDRWIESPNASSEMPPVHYKNETELRPFSDRERIELASRKCACSPDFVDWVPGGVERRCPKVDFGVRQGGLSAAASFCDYEEDAFDMEGFMEEFNARAL